MEKCEAILSLGQFLNIDIYQQGYYQIRVSVCGARLAKAHQVILQQHKQLKAPVCMPDNTYHSKVFYIRYREEFLHLNEVVHFMIQTSYEATLSIELWFLARDQQEIELKLPAQLISDVSVFKMVSQKNFSFAPKMTLEHSIAIFDQGFTSVVQFNLICIERPAMVSEQVQGQVTQTRRSLARQHAESLISVYDLLRSFYTTLCAQVGQPTLSEIHKGRRTLNFGPIWLHSGSQQHMPIIQQVRTGAFNLKVNRGIDHEVSSNESFEQSRSGVCSPILQPSQMTRTSLIHIDRPTSTITSMPRVSNPVPNISQSSFAKVTSKSAVPSLTSQRFAQQRKQRKNSKASDEVSSSGSDSAQDLSLTVQNQNHLTQHSKGVKTLYEMKSGQQKDEDIPFYEHLEASQIQRQRAINRHIQNKKPGSKSNSTYEMARLLGETNYVVIQILELWHYITKICYKQIEIVTKILRQKYIKVMQKLHTRIIVPIEDEEPSLRQSIKNSGVRKDRRDPHMLLITQEIQQESIVLQPHRRGRPQMSKPCEPLIPTVGHQRNRKLNKSQQPITPGRIEKSLLLANNRRLDVSAQQEIKPFFPEQEVPKIQFKTKVKNQMQPIVIEEVCYDEDRLFAETLNQSETRSSHLFVFVHGFQGYATDLLPFKKHLQALIPNALYLISKANEKLTDSSIEVLGQNLATEVIQFVAQYIQTTLRADRYHFVIPAQQATGLKKLTFIGHSLGGIIVRAALKHLQMYKNQMHGYVSLGSPHLGYMYNSSTWVDAGMWFLKKFTASQSLQQLSMTDARDFKDTFLYKLSQDNSMATFKYVILIGSFQDSYAPYDSARVQVCTKALQQSTKNRDTYLQMAENILGSLNCQQLVRLDVNFKIEDGSFASMIGRTAHIQMIESEPLIQALIHKYTEVFQL